MFREFVIWGGGLALGDCSGDVGGFFLIEVVLMDYFHFRALIRAGFVLLFVSIIPVI